jgi:hypothetical protein
MMKSYRSSIAYGVSLGIKIVSSSSSTTNKPLPPSTVIDEYVFKFPPTIITLTSTQFAADINVAAAAAAFVLLIR